MSTENVGTSPSTVVTESRDAKAGNMSIDQATAHLLKLSQEPKNEAPAKAVETEPTVPVATEEVEAQADDPLAVPQEIVDEATPESEGDAEAPATEADAEPDDVLSQLESLDPKAKELAESLLKKQKERLVGKFEKRIGKEVAKKKGIEAQVQSLSEQLNEIRSQSTGQPKVEPIPQTPVINPNNPLANIQDIQTLNVEFENAKKALRTSEDLLAEMDDNGLDSIKYGDQEFSKQQIKAASRNARRVIEDYAPQQAQFLQARQNALTHASQTFPWYSDKNSTEYALAQRFLADPQLGSRADREYIAGLLIEGAKVIEARQKSSKSSPKATPKPKAPASQAELSSTSGLSRAADTDVSKSRLSSEIRGLTEKKGGLSGSEAAKLLLKRESLNKR